VGAHVVLALVGRDEEQAGEAAAATMASTRMVPAHVPGVPVGDATIGRASGAPRGVREDTAGAIAREEEA
jgi:hypothetical protein